MRWSYKTVYYELKKEGLLGSSFLDEGEVEESLNEYGHAGWELVSLIEVKDGLIGVLKQPLDSPMDTSAADAFARAVNLETPQPAVEEVTDVGAEQEPQPEESEDEIVLHPVEEDEVEEEQFYSSYEDWEAAENTPDDEEEVEKPERKIGEIRIE